MEQCKVKTVKLLLQSPAKKISVDRSGVKGVLTEIEGKATELSCDAVIVAAGGYAGNKEILKKYYSS